jgi:predicted cupin superfamily sugar epimerase
VRWNICDKSRERVDKIEIAAEAGRQRRASGMAKRRDVLTAAATLTGAAALLPGLSSVAHSATRKRSKRMAALSAQDVRNILQLKPHPTCGYVRVTYMSGEKIARGGLPAPFADGQALGSGLYFQVTPERPVRLHRILNDQLYHYYLGDPLEVFLLRSDEPAERVVVGPDLRAGQLVQLFIPGGTFHTARLLGRSGWFLGASTEWPGVIPRDVQIGNVDELAAKYPQFAQQIRAIAAVPR